MTGMSYTKKGEQDDESYSPYYLVEVGDGCVRLYKRSLPMSWR